MNTQVQQHKAEKMVTHFMSQRLMLLLSFGCVALLYVPIIIQQLPALSLFFIVGFILLANEIRKQMVLVTLFPFRRIQPVNHFPVTNLFSKPFYSNNKFKNYGY